MTSWPRSLSSNSLCTSFSLCSRWAGTWTLPFVWLFTCNKNKKTNLLTKYSAVVQFIYHFGYFLYDTKTKTKNTQAFTDLIKLTWLKNSYGPKIPLKYYLLRCCRFWESNLGLSETKIILAFTMDLPVSPNTLLCDFHFMSQKLDK